MCSNRMSRDGETEKSQTEIFNKNIFDLNQKLLLVFQAFCLLKNTKETSGETNKPH